MGKRKPGYKICRECHPLVSEHLRRPIIINCSLQMECSTPDTEEDVVILFSQCYEKLCSHTDTNLMTSDLTQSMKLAGQVILEYTKYSRECLMSSLTLCHQLLDSHTPTNMSITAMCRLLIEDTNFVQHVMRLIDGQTDRFILYQTKQVVLSCIQCLCSNQTDDNKLKISAIGSALNSTYTVCITEDSHHHKTPTCIEILQSAISYLANNRLSSHLQQYIDMYYGWWSISIPRPDLSDIITVALLKAMCKIMKVNKHSVTVFSVYLRSSVTQTVMSTTRHIMWRSLYKAYYKILTSDNDEDSTVLELCQWLLSADLLNSALGSVPVSLSCVSSWQKCDDIRAGCGDVSALRTVTLVMLKAIERVLVSKQLRDCKDHTAVMSRLTQLNVTVCHRLNLSAAHKGHRGHISVWFYDLFMDQDDVMSEALLSVSQIYKLLSKHSILVTEVDILDPVELFAAFLSRISHDHRVLIDLIVSPETQFLSYILTVLHHLIYNWQSIVTSALLDTDLSTNTWGDNYETPSCSSSSTTVLQITSGLEALMSYNDDSYSDSEDDYNMQESNSIISDHSSGEITANDHSSGEITTNISDIISVLCNVKDSLILMNNKNMIPFDITPLLCLLQKLGN